MRLSIFIYFILYLPFVHGKVCILNFERPNHFTTEVIRSVMERNNEHKVIITAKPIDIISCVKEGFEELILIAHAIYNPEKPDYNAKFGYYRPLTETEYKSFLEDVSNLHAEYEKSKIRKVRFKNGKRVSFINEDYKRWKHLNSILEDISNGRIFYKMDKFHTTIFNFLQRILKEQKSNNNLKLKKIRIASCMKDSLQKRYTILEEISKDFNLEIDWHPDTKLGSWINGVQSVQLEKGWLEESLNQ
jgi:hypothetical protein